MSDDGFFSRWSRRKAEVRSQTQRDEPAAAWAPEPAAPVVAEPAPQEAPQATAVQPAPATPPAEPPPTLEEAAELTPQSADFSRFVRPGVAPEVRHTALKTLFADPHFNVMDGLDVYIDDYGRPDPLPPSMLRQMVQSQLLGLFDAEPAPPPPAPAPAADEDPDLRLQPDDAAGRAEPGAGAGEDPGRQP